MGDEEGEAVVVDVVAFVVSHLVEFAVEVEAAEGFGVADLVLGVAVGADRQLGGVEAAGGHGRTSAVTR